MEKGKIYSVKKYFSISTLPEDSETINYKHFQDFSKNNDFLRSLASAQDN